MMGHRRTGRLPIVIVIVAFFFGITILGGISGGMMGGGFSGGMMGFGWLFMVLPILFIIFIIYSLLDRDSTPREGPPQHRTYGTETPMQILERRYAGGEISREEFFRMKEEIYNR
jgi:putative membrane protein